MINQIRLRLSQATPARRTAGSSQAIAGRAGYRRYLGMCELDG